MFSLTEVPSIEISIVNFSTHSFLHFSLQTIPLLPCSPLARFSSPLINFFLTPITGWEVELNLRLSSTFTSMGATSLHSQVVWCARLCLKHIAFATMFTLILFSLLLLLLPSLRALVLGHHFFFSTSPASAFFSSSNSRQLTPSHSTPLSFLFLS